MKFNIRSIEIENFRSIQDKVTVNINPGLYVIEGINLDEKNSTNGCGKQEPLDKIIPTPTGYRKFGSLKKGDLIFDINGDFQYILGTYPQNTLKTYTIFFSNGASVECGEEHLWGVYKENSYKVLSTKELLKTNEYKNYYLPTIGLPKYAKKQYKVDPALYGILCTLSDKEKDKSLDYIFKKYKLTGVIDKNISTKYNKKDLDLSNLSMYLTGDIIQRSKILSGLLSILGKVKKDKIIVNSNNIDLLKAIQQLVFSLNGNAYLKRNLFGNYSLTIKLFEEYPFVFYNNKYKKYKFSKKDKVYITDIKYTGEKPSMCIKVSNKDELYLTNDYIPTHNTTLVSALYWCLTGNTITDETLADEVVNLTTNKNCKVVVNIESSQGDIKITRTRKDEELGNNLLLEINGQDVSSHKIVETQSRLNQLVKIPFEVLRSTIIMTSGMENAFCQLTPVQRVQTLESIRDYSIWEKAKTIALSNAKKQDSLLHEVELNLSNFEGKLDIYNNDLARLTKEKETLLENENTIAKIDSDLVTLDKNKTEIETEISGIKFVDSSDIEIKLNEISKEVDEFNIKKTEYVFQINKLEHDNILLNSELKMVDSLLKETICPVCKQKLIRTKEEIELNTNKHENLLKNLNNNLNTIDELKKNVDIIIDKIDILSEKSKNLANEGVSRNLDASNKKSSLENKLSEIKLNIYKLNQKKTELINRKIEIDNLLSERLHNINDLKDKINTLNIEKTKITENKNLYTFYTKLLGSKGELRPWLLQRDIDFINIAMQKYIARFFKNTEVELFLKEASIEILIRTQNITKSISRLSSGEKKRINIAIQLALYDLIKTSAQTEFNLLCLDEIEQSTDPIGCQQLIEIIEDKAEDIETVWWISNNTTVKENISNKIIVQKALDKTTILQ